MYLLKHATGELPVKKFIIIILLIPVIISAQSLDKKINQLVTKYYEAGKFNGSVLVAQNDKVIFKGGFGEANMEWNIPNAPNTKHRIGSITKQFTSFIIMKLVQEGKIKVTGFLSDYLPYYRKDTGAKVTVEHLLTHTSGIPSYTAREDMEKIGMENIPVDEFVKKYCSDDLSFEPGSQFLYNNSGYFILGAIIEQLTGMTYEAALHKYILDPLELKDTGYDSYSKIIPNRATGYTRTAVGFKTAPYLDMSVPYAAGSMYSTVEDLYKWDLSLKTENLLAAKYVMELFKPRIDARGQKYGYGWMINRTISPDDKDSITIIAHGGGVNGFSSYNMRVIEPGYVVTIADNATGSSQVEISNLILNLLYGKDYKNPAKRLIPLIYNAINEDGVDDAIRLFNELKNDKDNFSYTENDINQLGYLLIEEKKLEEAVKILELNTILFPKSSNVWDSYGEALLKSGDKEKAIANFKKSIELDPQNSSSYAHLKEMGIVIEKKSDLVLTIEKMKEYEGKYQIAPNFILEIMVEDSKLLTQATGQPKFEIFCSDVDKFYLKVVDAKVEFNRDDNGDVNSLSLYQSGQVIPCKKIE